MVETDKVEQELDDEDNEEGCKDRDGESANSIESRLEKWT